MLICTYYGEDSEGRGHLVRLETYGRARIAECESCEKVMKALHAPRDRGKAPAYGAPRAAATRSGDAAHLAQVLQALAGDPARRVAADPARAGGDHRDEGLTEE